MQIFHYNWFSSFSKNQTNTIYYVVFTKYVLIVIINIAKFKIVPIFWNPDNRIDNIIYLHSTYINS